ncbi:MAG: GH25 family lysozyme [Anaerolineaceae bacterium]|nr:GH25 family lysozyme [Anaerolineaceae bacterium]
MKPIIDISYWQNPRNINYDHLASSVEGVIIRTSYGSRKDAYFDTHYTEFTKRGIPIGVYSFLTEYMPVDQQVATYKRMVEGKIFKLGFWADIEAEAGAELLTLATIRKWLSMADATLGVRHGIYTSWWMWQQCAGNAVGFGDRALWVAHYGVINPRLPAGWSDWLFHQYSSTVIHPGYNYVLDTNRFNGDEAKWAAYLAAGSSNETPNPLPEPSVLWKGRVIPAIGLNVRSERDYTKPNVLRTLPANTEVQVFEEVGAWVRISPDKQEWVVSRFLEVIKDGIVSDVLPIKPLYQRAYPQKLGFSNTTIAGYGCLLTCATMLVNYQLKRNYTPPEMNEIIKRVNGFVSGNLFVFSSVWNAFPGKIGADKLIRTPLTPAPLHEIDTILSTGRPVIVETRLNKAQQHWVLIVGKCDGRYVINDPWTGKQQLFDEIYGDPARWIYSIVSYKTL